MVVRLYEIKGGLSFLVTPYGQYLNYPFVIFFLKKKAEVENGSSINIYKGREQIQDATVV